MTKKELQMTFNGVEMSDFFRITDVVKPIMADRDITTDDAPILGVNVQRVKRGAKTLEIKFVMRTEDGESMERLKYKLAGVLDVSDPVRVTFSEEPDKYYLAIPSANVEPDAVASWLQKGELELLVPDGVAHSITYKRVTESRTVGNKRVFTIQNDGNHPAKPIIKVTHPTENGYLGFVNSSGALEIGNPEEADTEDYKKSDVLLDYTSNGRVSLGLQEGQKNVGVFNDGSQRLGGTLAMIDTWGRPHIALAERGGTSGLNGASVSWDIPRDTSGETGGLYDYIWWRQIFWLGAANQYGFIKLSVTAADGSFLYGVETYKRANGLGSEYNLLVSNGQGGYNIVRRFRFNATHHSAQNPFNEPNGWSDIRRTDETVTFFWSGSYFPFVVPEIKGKKSAKIHVMLGAIDDKPLVTHMYIDGLVYRKDHVSATRNILNLFRAGSTVELNSENLTAFVNNLPANNLVVRGSDWLQIPRGKSELEVYASSWIKGLPDITINFEELY